MAALSPVHLGPRARLVTSPCLVSSRPNREQGPFWGLLGHQISSAILLLFSERLRAHAGVCLLPEGSCREGFSLPLTPLFQSWESNLKLTASVCSEPKAFDLPSHSQMPFPPTLMIFTIVTDKALLCRRGWRTTVKGDDVCELLWNL